MNSEGNVSYLTVTWMTTKLCERMPNIVVSQDLNFTVFKVTPGGLSAFANKNFVHIFP